MRQLLQSLIEHPRKMFWIDGIGALLSTVFLIVLLFLFQPWVGMPMSILQELVVITGIFTIYSLSCALFNVQNWRLFLKIIAIANTLYCCLTIYLIIDFYAQLTIVGLLYFLLEILVIALLVGLEWKVIRSKPE